MPVLCRTLQKSLCLQEDFEEQEDLLPLLRKTLHVEESRAPQASQYRDVDDGHTAWEHMSAQTVITPEPRTHIMRRQNSILRLPISAPHQTSISVTSRRHWKWSITSQMLALLSTISTPVLQNISRGRWSLGGGIRVNRIPIGCNLVFHKLIWVGVLDNVFNTPISSHNSGWGLEMGAPQMWRLSMKDCRRVASTLSAAKTPLSRVSTRLAAAA